MSKPVKQHPIDPEIRIRCYACEAARSVQAIERDGVDGVVNAAMGDFRMDCTYAACTIETGASSSPKCARKAGFMSRPIEKRSTSRSFVHPVVPVRAESVAPAIHFGAASEYRENTHGKA